MNTGVEGSWMKLRRNNMYYIPIKITSILLSLSLAAFTIFGKQYAQAYWKQAKLIARADDWIGYDADHGLID